MPAAGDRKQRKGELALLRACQLDSGIVRGVQDRFALKDCDLLAVERQMPVAGVDEPDNQIADRLRVELLSESLVDFEATNTRLEAEESRRVSGVPEVRRD